MTSAEDRADRGAADDSTFSAGRPAWLGRLDNVRNVVRQELISRQLDKHMRTGAGRVLDVGAGQGTQSIRLARAGHQVLAVEPDPEMRGVFQARLDSEPDPVRDRVTLRNGSIGDLPEVAGVEIYDVVLLLGVLMYLPASQPASNQRAGGTPRARRLPRRRRPHHDLSALASGSPPRLAGGAGSIRRT